MALTPSVMVELGTPAPDFSLISTEGKTVKLSDYKGTPLLVMFICNHCPYVQHIRDNLAKVTAEYLRKGVSIVGINSNDTENYPEDSPDMMKAEVASIGYKFPYLYDRTQEVARSYKAACTPDFFLYDKNHRLVYRGQYDGSRPGNKTSVTGADLKSAMDAVLAGRPIDQNQKASIGCNIKWKSS